LVASEGMNVGSADADVAYAKEGKSGCALRHFCFLRNQNTRLITYPLLHGVEINNFN
jgi:hypothetical protein